MSWRSVFGLEEIPEPLTQNTHITQNPETLPNSVYCAKTVIEDTKTEVQLTEDLSTACLGLEISPNEVYKALSPDDIKAWQQEELTLDALKGFAHSLEGNNQRELGYVPHNYTQQANCKFCGPIWLWLSEDVWGCPWCWSRVDNKPIPRPCSVSCKDCKHFKRKKGHVNLGHCDMNQPEPIAGLWDSDKRDCKFYIPIQKR